MTPESDPLARYRRQVQFAPLGEAGQRRLADARVLVCGCGALGSAAAELLVRAGVGTVRIVDRDFLELDNLHRQTLFVEADVTANLPKAVAAARRLGEINSEVRIEPLVADVTCDNLAEIAEQADCIVDGTDNFEIRYLLNDFAVANKVPWVFGGCVGCEGQTMAILPDETPCLCCILPEPPPVELQPTCETAGVLGPAVTVIAAIQAVEAIKILSGNLAAVSRRMAVINLWDGSLRTMGLSKRGQSDACRACQQHDFPWLEGRRGSSAVTLCGRNAVQLRDTGAKATSLGELAEKLSAAGTVTSNDYLVRLEVDDYTLTVFAGGRTIVTGTDDPAQARAIHARYIGG
ncbi:ThiF family adenylyltransferase [Pirellulales bacterium]|nr:ThiF family adenylyltransferase [Pirellulales bacterium]